MCAVSSMDRVADFESVGWGFESLTACQNNPPKEHSLRFAGGFFARDAQEHEMRLASSSNVKDNPTKIPLSRCFFIPLSWYIPHILLCFSSISRLVSCCSSTCSLSFHLKILCEISVFRQDCQSGFCYYHLPRSSASCEKNRSTYQSLYLSVC